MTTQMVIPVTNSHNQNGKTKCLGKNRLHPWVSEVSEVIVPSVGGYEVMILLAVSVDAFQGC